MLDYRIKTFLKLCDTMNYRITAEQLNMTQPAVTQHIQFLEREFNCSLFSYNGKRLLITDAGRMLENYARSAYYNEMALRKKMVLPDKPEVRIGATKTIGDFVINKQIACIMQRNEFKVSLLIDNTEHLLNLLDHEKLDFTLIEGFFNKQKYGYQLFKKEPFLGICAASHPFAGKKVSFYDLFDETVFIREAGSGTRAIFEQVLFENNFTWECFNRMITISSFKLITELVADKQGISFVYKAIALNNEKLATFTIEDIAITREFNYVYLKNSSAINLLDKFSFGEE